MKSLVRSIPAGLVIFVDLFSPRKKKVDLVRDKEGRRINIKANPLPEIGFLLQYVKTRPIDLVA
jgi:hypothetical protein